MFICMDGDQAQPENEPLKEDATIRELIASFWNDLRNSEDTGATTWEVLEPLERGATDALSQVPANIKLAERITAEAWSVIQGFESD